jgi:hypothetical protein
MDRTELAKFLIDLLKTERILLDRYPNLNLQFGRSLINNLVILTNEHKLMLNLLKDADIDITPSPQELSEPFSYLFNVPDPTQIKFTIEPVLRGNFVTNLFYLSILNNNSQVNNTVEVLVNTQQAYYSPSLGFFVLANPVFPEKVEIKLNILGSSVITLKDLSAIII